MATVIICLVLFFLVLLGIKNFLKRMSSGCCSGGDTLRRLPVHDKNQAHYPYTVMLKVDGMTCRNCAVRVENALNTLDGVWARVNLEDKTAVVCLKQDLSDEQLAAPVCRAGYTVLEVQRSGRCQFTARHGRYVHQTGCCPRH